MRGTDSHKYATAAAATSTARTLTGGAYTLDVVATGSGSVVVNRLGPDGTTWLLADAALSLTASGTSGAVALPPGQYEFVVTGFTNVSATLQRIPGE